MCLYSSLTEYDLVISDMRVEKACNEVIIDFHRDMVDVAIAVRDSFRPVTLLWWLLIGRKEYRYHQDEVQRITRRQAEIDILLYAES